MEKLLKIHPVILLALVIGPFFVLRKTSGDSELLAFILLFTPFLVINVWYMAVYIFLWKELNEKRSDLLLMTVLIGVPLLANILYCYYASYSSFGNHFKIDRDISGEELGSAQWIAREFRYWRYTLLLPLWIALAIRTKKYLYARSVGFILMELIVPLMGMITLSPVLLKEKKERNISHKKS